MIYTRNPLTGRTDRNAEVDELPTSLPTGLTNGLEVYHCHQLQTSRAVQVSRFR
jgi:hypothetical protein